MFAVIVLTTFPCVLAADIAATANATPICVVCRRETSKRPPAEPRKCLSDLRNNRRACSDRTTDPAAAHTVIASPACTYVFLDHSSPAVDATVPAPKEISIWFKEEEEPASSRIEVTDSSGTRVDEGGTHIDAANRELLRGGVEHLRPGTLKVAAHGVSVDRHHRQGDFTVTVAP